VPKGHQVALTAKALANVLLLDNYESILQQWDHIIVHWDAVVEEFKDLSLMDNFIARRIIDLWENDYLKDTPFCGTELQVLASLNDVPGWEDNISVYCATLGEYEILRKTYGKEDVNYFRRT
jgi:hypothetical protein